MEYLDIFSKDIIRGRVSIYLGNLGLLLGGRPRGIVSADDLSSRCVGWSEGASLAKPSSERSDSIGRCVSVEGQICRPLSNGWESDTEVNVPGLFVGINGLARLFHRSACFCFPGEEVGVIGAVVRELRFGIK